MPIQDLSTENLVVVFGAGASFDSSMEYSRAFFSGENPHPTERPPLAMHLFKQQMYGGFIDDFRHAAAGVAFVDAEIRRGRGVEQALKLLEEDGKSNPHRASQAMAVRYYLNALIESVSQKWLGLTHGVTNYVTLVGEIEHWRRQAHERRKQVTYVTFNYDMLLEEALLEGLGLNFESVDQYTSNEHAVVLRPHGCIGWKQSISPFTEDRPSAVTPQVIIDSAERIKPTGVWFTDAQNTMYADRPSIPAIALPIEKKSVFECPDAHVQKLDRRLEAADKFLIIGWAGAEEHFLQRLRTALGSRRAGFYVVAEREAAASDTWDKMRIPNPEPKMGPRSFRCSPSTGFSAFMASNELKTFLEEKLPPITSVCVPE